MDKIITIGINVASLLFFILLVNEYTDVLLVTEIVILICYLFYLLFKYRRKYIPKDIILIYPICIVFQCVIVNVLEKIGIWKISNGLMGLSTASLGALFYFCLYFFLFVLLILINCLKYVIIKFKTIKEKQIWK